MTITVGVISSLLLASAVAMFVLAGRVATRYTASLTAEVRLFVLFASLAGLWSLASALELLSPGLTPKIFGAKVQYISIVFLPPIWLIFVLRYTDTFRHVRNWFYLCFIPSGATLLVVWTNEWHGLMWQNIWLEPEPFPVAVFERGPWFEVVLVPFSYLVLVLTLGVLIKTLWVTPRGQRGQLWLLLGTQFVPVLANLVYLLRLAPFDLTPLGFAASSFLLGFGLFRQRLMQQLPIAYRHVFEQMRDGVLVLDSDRKLLSYNREAGRLLALSDKNLNHTLEDIRPHLAPLFAELWERRQHECQHGGVAFEFNVRDMMTETGGLQGYLLTVEDATERKRQQVMLEQQARELELLDRVRVAVANQLSLSEVMHVSVEAVADVFGYKLVSVYLLEDDTLQMQHQVGYDTFIERIPVSRGVMGRVARTAQPVLVTNPKNESDFFEAVGGILSEVAVPLISGGRVVGVFNLESTEAIFTETDVKLMMALSEQIAIAVERARLYEDVSRNEKQLRLLTENMSDLICLHALDGTFTYVSPSSRTLFGYEPHELLGKSPFDFIHPDDLEFVKSQTRQLRQGKTPKPYLQRCRRKNGSYIWVEMFNHPVFDSSSQMTSVVAVSRDVTERKRLQEQMLEGALLYDALTGLPNRVLFMDRVQQASRRSQRSLVPFAVMFLDLDRFKVVNDSLGHRAGDVLLVEVAKRIQHCVRAGDTAARLGGDEFAILLEAIDEREAKHLAERIQQSLRLPFVIEGHEVVSSASIGIILGQNLVDPEDLLRRADMAMYQSKAQGKARYTVFDEAMHADVQATLKLEADLRKALVKNELEVFYQPIMRLADQTLVGFEALIRWRHPENGLLPPARFITTAEDMGLIGEIDLWVLQEACQQLNEWQRATSQPLAVSVNVSAKSLLLAGFADRVLRIIEAAGVQAESVRLELTESVLMDEASKEILANLRSQGVRLVIDDFGTGYSSLSYLHALPLDALKIDRSFINDMNSTNMQIVNTIILLAQSLGLDVVAEGIEGEEQLRQLRELACEFGQGFLFGGATISQQMEEKFLHEPVFSG